MIDRVIRETIRCGRIFCGHQITDGIKSKCFKITIRVERVGAVVKNIVLINDVSACCIYLVGQVSARVKKVAEDLLGSSIGRGYDATLSIIPQSVNMSLRIRE